MDEIFDMIGARLIRARHARGLSQARLAAAAGLTRETVYRVERGREATADTLARLASALGIERERLMLVEDYSSRLFGHPRRTPLRDVRRALGLSLRECAAKAGVSETTLSRFERGNHHFPSLCVVGRFGLAREIHNEGLASSLGFASAAALTEYWLTDRYDRAARADPMRPASTSQDDTQIRSGAEGHPSRPR